MSERAYIGTFLSTKGGVGKTTTIANFAGLLTDLGMRVLMIDADTQPSLTKYYPIAQRANFGLTDMLRSGFVSENHISRIELKHPDPNVVAHNGCLDLICSDIPDGSLEKWLEARGDKWFRLKMILATPFINERYDVVLIDTKGAIGAIQQSAVFASNFMVSPVSPDIISAREFAAGTLGLLSEISPGDEIGLKVPPLHVLICKLARTRNARAIAQQLRAEYRSQGERRIPNISMLNAHIPDAVAYCEAATARRPVHWVDPVRAGQIMHQLLWEIFPSLEGFVAPACEGAFPIEVATVESYGGV